MLELLSVGQMAKESGHRPEYIIDAIRMDKIKPYSVGGSVNFCDKTLFHRDHVLVEREDFDEFENDEFDIFTETRDNLLLSIGDDQDRIGPQALRLHVGALLDDPDDQYSEGVVAALEYQYSL